MADKDGRPDLGDLGRELGQATVDHARDLGIAVGVSAILGPLAFFPTLAIAGYLGAKQRDREEAERRKNGGS